MSKLIGSKYGVRGLLAAVFVLAVGVVVATPKLVTGQTLGGRDQPIEALDARTYTQVQSLREAVGLTNDDLATLGLSETQAQAVMLGLIEWTTQNQSRLDAADANERRLARDLREAQRQVNVGPRDERLLKSMSSQSEDLRQARATQRSLRQEGARQALAAAQSGQRAQWESIYGRSAQTRLSQAELQRADDFRIASQGGVVAKDDRGRKISESAQRQAFRQTRTNRLPEVLAAERRVLPIPEELTEPLDPSVLRADGLLIEPRVGID